MYVVFFFLNIFLYTQEAMKKPLRKYRQLNICLCTEDCVCTLLNKPLSIIQTYMFAHGAVGRRIDPSWGGPIELFLVPASAPRLV